MGDIERRALIRCKLAILNYTDWFYIEPKSESYLLKWSLFLKLKVKRWTLLFRDEMEKESCIRSLSPAIQ